MSRYPDYLSPNPTPTKLTKAQKSRARREPSGVFSLFQAPQIQQFKEAFQLIDHDKDGWVNENDLKEIFSSLGMFSDNCRSITLNPVTLRHRSFKTNDGRSS
jgi:myosin regulatory light chain 12